MTVVVPSIPQQDAEPSVAYVRTAPVAPMPPPASAHGAFGWLRANFFATPFDAALTVAMILLLAWIVPPFLDFMVFNAVWSGADREACLATPARPEPTPSVCWRRRSSWNGNAPPARGRSYRPSGTPFLTGGALQRPARAWTT